MSTENRPDPRVVMKVLLANRKALESRLAEVIAEKSMFHHDGQYFATAYDCLTKRERTIDSLMRDIDRANDNIMMVDDEIAVMEFWTDLEDVDGLELHTIAKVLGVDHAA